MTYKLGQRLSSEEAMYHIEHELENLGLGNKKTLANISLIVQDYEKSKRMLSSEIKVPPVQLIWGDLWQLWAEQITSRVNQLGRKYDR